MDNYIFHLYIICFMYFFFLKTHLISFISSVYVQHGKLHRIWYIIYLTKNPTQFQEEPAVNLGTHLLYLSYLRRSLIHILINAIEHFVVEITGNLYILHKVCMYTE